MCVFVKVFFLNHIKGSHASDSIRRSQSQRHKDQNTHICWTYVCFVFCPGLWIPLMKAACELCVCTQKGKVCQSGATAGAGLLRLVAGGPSLEWLLVEGVCGGGIEISRVSTDYRIKTDNVTHALHCSGSGLLSDHHSSPGLDRCLLCETKSRWPHTSLSVWTHTRTGDHIVTYHW